MQHTESAEYAQRAQRETEGLNRTVSLKSGGSQCTKGTKETNEGHEEKRDLA